MNNSLNELIYSTISGFCTDKVRRVYISFRPLFYCELLLHAGLCLYILLYNSIFEYYVGLFLLAWSLFGPTAIVKESDTGMGNLIQRNKDQLQWQLEMFWEIDFGYSLVNDETSMSIEDSQALQIVETTAIKVEGHYQIALPWRSSHRSMTELVFVF